MISTTFSKVPQQSRPWAWGPGSRAKVPRVIRRCSLPLTSYQTPAPASLDWGAVKEAFTEEGAFELNV